MPPSNDYILPSTDSEALRIEAQGVLYGGASFLDPFLATRPARVLEVGCGTGFICRQVARSLPGSAVLGVDLDPARVAYARQQDHGPGCTFAQGDVSALALPDDHFDLVYARMCLLHLPEPEQALAEMARVTRPGGQVVAYEMVHDGVWFSPPKPAFERFLAKVLQWLRGNGVEPSQGLHIPGAMMRAGLQDVRAGVIPHYALAHQPLYDAHRANWVATVRELAGVLDAEDLRDAALEELEDRRADQFVTEITVLASGTVAPGA